MASTHTPSRFRCRALFACALTSLAATLGCAAEAREAQAPAASGETPTAPKLPVEPLAAPPSATAPGATPASAPNPEANAGAMGAMPGWASKPRAGCAVGQAAVRSSRSLALSAARAKARRQLALVLARERVESTTEASRNVSTPDGTLAQRDVNKHEDLAEFGETESSNFEELDGVIWAEVCAKRAVDAAPSR